MIDEINLHHVHPEVPRNFRRGPVPHRIKIKDLQVLRFYAAPNAIQRCL